MIPLFKLSRLGIGDRCIGDRFGLVWADRSWTMKNIPIKKVGIAHLRQTIQLDPIVTG